MTYPMVRTWSTIGNFNQILHSHAIVRRMVTFTCTRLTSAIKNVTLVDTTYGHFEIDLEMQNTEAYRQLGSILTSMGFALKHNILPTNHINFISVNPPLMGYFLSTVRAFSPDFEEIKQIIANLLHINVNEPFRIPPLIPQPWVPRRFPEPRFSFLQNIIDRLNTHIFYTMRLRMENEYFLHMLQRIIMQPTATSVNAPSLEELLNRSMHDTSMAVPREPEPGENHKKIVALGIEEKNIPEEFCCAITSFAMTDPVYDPKTPHIKWDRPNILRCLESKANNPFANTPLTPENLITDTSLKVVIDFYILNQEKRAKILAPFFKRLKAKIDSEFMRPRVDADATRATNKTLLR